MKIKEIEEAITTTQPGNVGAKTELDVRTVCNKRGIKITGRVAEGLPVVKKDSFLHDLLNS